MMKRSRTRRSVERARALTDHVPDAVLSPKLVLSGEAGSLICEERRRREERVDASRSGMDGLGGGAMKAIEKSVSPEGEEGVTMMAGSAAFSSTRGSVRSISC